MARGKKYIIDYVRSYFAVNNCMLLDDTYINNRTAMRYLCICGNESKIAFYNFMLGQRCRKCGIDRSNIGRSLSYDYVKNYFKSFDCELLDEKYISLDRPLKYKCKCGRIDYKRFDNFRKGSVVCKKCWIKNISGKNSHHWAKDRELVNLNQKIRNKCNNMLRYCLKQTDQRKSCRTKDILGYTHEELLEHLQSCENWEEVKNKNWTIDHIFPIQAFLDYGIKDLKVINSLDNLNPLTLSDNCSKRHKYNKQDFEKYLLSNKISGTLMHVNVEAVK